MLLIAFSVLSTACKDSHSDHASPAADAHDHDAQGDHADHDNHDDHEHGQTAKTTKSPAGKENHKDHADHKDHKDGDDHDDHQSHAGEHKDDHKNGHTDEAPGGHVDEVTLTPQAIKRWNITLAQAKEVVLTNHITVPGRVSYDLEAIAHVGTMVSGKVTALKARIGDDVKKGQVLCEIISPELGMAQSDFLQKQSVITAAGASLQIAQTLHNNARKLYDESKGIALSEVQKREVDVIAQKGSLEAAQGARDAARNLLVLLGMQDSDIESLSKTSKVNPAVVITSPIAGRVIERFASLGESVSSDSDALMVVADLQKIWVIADVPESMSHQIHLNAKASIWPIVANPTPVLSHVAYIATELTAQTRTLPMRLEIDQAQTTLRPGMFVKVELTTQSQGGAVLAIQESAVQVVENATCVFVPVQGEANTFAKRVVKLGQAVGRQYPVLEGLTAGESYVVTGSFMLKADLGKSGAAHEH